MWAFKILTTLLICINFCPLLPSNSERILSIAFFASKSHYIAYQTLIEELAIRGHNVTHVSPIVSGKSIPNLKEIQTINMDEVYSKMPNLYELKQKNLVDKVNVFHMFPTFEFVCTETYKLPRVMNLLNEKFDLVILSALFNECVYGFVYKLNTSLILVSSVSAPSWVSTVLGTPTPTSFIPNIFTHFNQKMTFFERVQNFYSEISIRLHQDFKFKPKMEAIYREMLNDQSIPSVDAILQNASLLLSVSHLSISQIRPFMPDIIEIGGLHCRAAQPLPNELEEFVNKSGEDGFIFFSMGSFLKGSAMPESHRKIFLNTFSKLKQRVIWKWESDTFPEKLPNNILLMKWAPQQDILGHQKINLFITHGGFGSTTEAVFHGTPLFGIPMFGDQYTNMKKNVKLGFASFIDFNDLTEENLLSGILEMLNEPNYAKNAKELSQLFRDQINEPLERALYWTNYVLRHKGAVHLRSPARDLNYIQYFSIDVLLFLFSILFFAIFLSFKLFSAIIFKCCKRSQVKSSSKKRN